MYSEVEARKLVIKAGLELVDKKLVARTWGNISARVSENEFIITPSGIGYDQLTEDDLVKVKIEDLSYEGNIKPSSEKGIHAEVYKNRADVNFVIHTHQNYATAISLNKNVDFVGVASYGLPGTKGLKKNVTKVLVSRNENSILMERHGAICFGLSYEDAFKEALDLEEKAKEFFEANKKENKHKTRPYLDDYAQMYGLTKKPVEDDKEACNLIAYKNYLASFMGKHMMNVFDVMLQHLVFKQKYSKLKNKK